MNSQADPAGRQVNVNSASLEVLRDGVDGIGQVLAERIVAYRQANGPFAAVADLVRVPGIGPTSLSTFADQLSVVDLLVEEAPPALDPMALDRENAADSVGDVVPDAASDQEAVSPWDDEEPEGAMPELAGYLMDDGDLGDLDLDLDQDEADLAIGPVVATSKAEPPPSELAAAPTANGESSATSVAAVSPTPATLSPAVEPPAKAPPATEPPATEPPVSSSAATVSSSVAAPVEPAPRRRSWHDVLMVLLGGLLGVIITLVVALIISGTLDFAPRSQVDALSRNVNTMQSNQELAWQRLDEVTLKAGELERGLARLQPLLGRVEAVESELAAAQGALAETQQELTQAQKDLATLQVQVREQFAAVDKRVGLAEEQIMALDASMAELQAAFAKVEERVNKFDAFFAALRDLLVDLEGSPVSIPAAALASTPYPEPTPTAAG
jgi:competence protein ComEA